MSAESKESMVEINGPYKYKKADGSEIEIGSGGSFKMTDSEWKATIIGVDKLINAMAGSGKALKAEVVAEVQDTVLAADFYSMDLALKDVATQVDFRVMKAGGSALDWNFVTGSDTETESITPARPGFTWAGYSSEEFVSEDIDDASNLAMFIGALHVMQWTPTPIAVAPGKIGLVFRNVSDGVTLDSLVTGVVDFSTPIPVITCLSLTDVCVGGGDTLTIRGLNFSAGAQVEFNRTSAATVTVVSPEEISVVVPALPDLGTTLVRVNNSAATGGQGSVGSYQFVNAV